MIGAMSATVRAELDDLMDDIDTSMTYGIAETSYGSDIQNQLIAFSTKMEGLYKSVKSDLETHVQTGDVMLSSTVEKLEDALAAAEGVRDYLKEVKGLYPELDGYDGLKGRLDRPYHKD